MKNVILFISIFCTQCYVAQALTEEGLKLVFMKHLMKCTTEHPVEISELAKLQNWVLPKKSEVFCLLACTYKAQGIMTAQGKFDLEHGYTLAEDIKNGDEQRLLNGRKLAEVCFKVNDVEVTDGEKGCERAALIFNCAVTNIPKYGFRLV